MKVSIAMATYNGARFLQEQLDSFVAQTRRPDELVVSDDASTDCTVEILESFSRVAPFAVRIYRNTVNLGCSKNFERAISLCRGEVIFLSDQDDVWFPEKIEVVLNVFRSEDRPLVVINDTELTDASLNKTGLTLVRQVCSSGLPTDSFITGCCTALRTDILPLILSIPEHVAHDTWIHQIAITLGRRSLFLTPLQYYRRHGENASQWFPTKTTQVTVLDLMAHYRPIENSREGLRQHQEYLNVLFHRLNDRRAEVERLLKDDKEFEKVVNSIERERQAVKRRLALLERNRFFRLPEAWKMLRSGDYRYFNGWMSFLKDLIQ